jgi:hypothetical protein
MNGVAFYLVALAARYECTMYKTKRITAAVIYFLTYLSFPVEQPLQV